MVCSSPFRCFLCFYVLLGPLRSFLSSGAPHSTFVLVECASAGLIIKHVKTTKWARTSRIKNVVADHKDLLFTAQQLGVSPDATAAKKKAPKKSPVEQLEPSPYTSSRFCNVASMTGLSVWQ